MIITETEKKNLIDAMKNLLEEYDYSYAVFALDNIIEEWASQKATLIEAFKRHPNYLDGKFMIAFTHNYERGFDTKAVKEFRNWLNYNAMPEGMDNLPEVIKQRKRESQYLPDDLFDFFFYLEKWIDSKTISSEVADRLKLIIPEVHSHSGEKASRVINKICVYLGYDKHPNYNREFAKFADGLSPLTIKRHTILSINPLDYLTMSFGNSWASCHTIDKWNKRNMPNSYEGQYSSGTMSYMLDPSSMVFYTVAKEYDGNEYYTQPKINRQMFHWGQEKLVQSRLYPQDNDGDDAAYVPYRNIVQDIMSVIFDFPNLWTLHKGSDAASRYICSYGTHYTDYHHYSNCSLSRIKGSENENCFNVGARPICINCGNRHSIEENINCCDAGEVCENCGRRISHPDEQYWVGDYCYCEECVTYCDECGCYEINENVRYVESTDRYVCDYCLDERYVHCVHCDSYYLESKTTYVEDVGYVCEDCLNEDYVQCEDCGNYYPIDKTTYVEEFGYVCKSCLQYDYIKCDNCGNYYQIDDVIEHDGNNYCKDCYDEVVEENEENE